MAGGGLILPLSCWCCVVSPPISLDVLDAFDSRGSSSKLVVALVSALRFFSSVDNLTGVLVGTKLQFDKGTRLLVISG